MVRIEEVCWKTECPSICKKIYCDIRKKEMLYVASKSAISTSERIRTKDRSGCLFSKFMKERGINGELKEFEAANHLIGKTVTFEKEYGTIVAMSALLDGGNPYIDIEYKDGVIRTVRLNEVRIYSPFKDKMQSLKGRKGNG